MAGEMSREEALREMADRRRTREDYGELADKIAANKDIILQVGEGGGADRYVAKANDLLRDVVHPREGTRDADTFLITADHTKARLAKMIQQSDQLSVERFLHEVRLAFPPAEEANDGGVRVNWDRLGAELAPFCGAPPAVEFLLGPLEIEPRRRAVRQQRRVAEETGPAVRPSEGVGAAADVSALNDKRANNLHATLRESLAARGAGEGEEGAGAEERNVFRMLVQPNDFAQTVENMFDFSFLVKRSTGQIKRARGTAAPIINVMDSGREGATREGRQTVAAINYDDFEILQETFGLDPRTAAVPKRPPTLSIAEAERIEREQEQKRQRTK